MVDKVQVRTRDHNFEAVLWVLAGTAIFSGDINFVQLIDNGGNAGINPQLAINLTNVMILPCVTRAEEINA